MRVARTFRIPEHQLAEIDRLAKQQGLSRTEYMIRASLGTLDETTTQHEQRITDLEAAVARLQELAYG